MSIGRGNLGRSVGIGLLVLSLGTSTAMAADDGGLLLAPMIGGLEGCMTAPALLQKHAPSARLTRLCMAQPNSSGEVIRQTLKALSGGTVSPGAGVRLGYTLNIPLMRLYDRVGGRFEINTGRLRRYVHTVRDAGAPVVLYLSSNHFGAGTEIEDALAADPANLLRTRDGVLPEDRFHAVKVRAWSFTDPNAPVTQLRLRAVKAVLQELCTLPRSVAAHVEGVTLLGELHHMFPNFNAGMGFDMPYRVTDYSATSVTGFRRFLAGRFQSVGAMNAALQSNFSNFDAVDAPSKDIRREPLTNFFEHIDSYAHGILPVQGWLEPMKAKTGKRMSWVRVYLNGHQFARVPADLSRQDVLAALPAMGTSEVGWSAPLDFSALAPGIHTVTVAAEREDGQLFQLTVRRFSLMDRQRSKPVPQAVVPIPGLLPPPAELRFSVDTPQPDLLDVYYNPMVRLWLEYRQQQVQGYLETFAREARSAGACLSADRFYSHQILPFSNPTWDVTKFAVGRDLAVPPDLSLGVSLYGEASYGHTFFDWFSRSARPLYAVTEFHPLRAMAPQELAAVFTRHKNNGARFLSFFMEAEGLGDDRASKPNPHSFNIQNKSFGSDDLYRATQAVLQGKATRK